MRSPALQWCHNDHDGVSNHQLHDCLLKRLLGRRSKKTSMLCDTGLCEWNSPVTGEFPTQMASNAENVSIWWRHHGDYRGSHHEYCDFPSCPGDFLCHHCDYPGSPSDYISLTTLVVTGCTDLTMPNLVKLTTFSFQYVASLNHNELSYLCISPHYLIKLYDRHCFLLPSQWNTINSLYIFHYPTTSYGPICIT